MLEVFGRQDTVLPWIVGDGLLSEDNLSTSESASGMSLNAQVTKFPRSRDSYVSL
jgi:hypothetical protein